VNRIQLVQHIYLEDYRAQVKQMAEELSGIRAVLDEELLKQRCTPRPTQPTNASSSSRRSAISSAGRSSSSTRN
jgi:hypothetical protein